MEWLKERLDEVRVPCILHKHLLKAQAGGMVTSNCIIRCVIEIC